MGRKWKKRGGGRNKMGSRNDRQQQQQGGDKWSSTAHGGNTKDWIAAVVKAGNAQMEAFYAAQGIHNYHWNHHHNDDETKTLQAVPDFEAWQKERLAWRNSMGLVLPASFRIHRDLPQILQKELVKELEELLDKARQEAKDEKEEHDDENNPLETHDGTGQPVARPLTFLPDGALGFQLNLDRAIIRKHPRLKPLHEWLKTVTDAGHITRQETVSMIPPAVLKPSPTDVVLDMCASPGSKTCQLLEYLTEGCIVANDANPERADVLTSRLKRVIARNPACLVTACLAQHFPVSVANGFDKILADVPCSGDGTSRKNIDVWKRWTVRNGQALHPLQLQIACRGVKLLRRNSSAETQGEQYLCYSTCSQSPYENEAVVAALLQRFDDLELVETTLSGFCTRPGLSTWKVFDVTTLSRRKRAKQQQAIDEQQAKSDKKEDVHDEDKIEAQSTKPAEDDVAEDTSGSVAKPFDPTSMDEAALLDYAKETGLIYYETFESLPADVKGRIRPSMFPPTDPSDLHLDRCLRVLPHDNDTGGFFVALLRKKKNGSSLSQSPLKKKARVDEAAQGKSGASEENGMDEGGDTDANNGEEPSPVDTSDLSGALDADNQPVLRSSTKAVKGEGAFVPLDDDLWNPLIEFYGLNSSPQFRKDCFMARIGSDAKVIHFVAPAVKAILDAGIQEEIHVRSGSAKAFAKNSMSQDCTVSHRVAQEAIAFVAPLMTKRKVAATRDDFDKCLDRNNLPIAQFSTAFQEEVRPLSVGGLVVELKDDRLPASAGFIGVVLWRGRGDSLQLLVTAQDVEAIKKLTTFLLGPSAVVKAQVVTKSTDAALYEAETTES